MENDEERVSDKQQKTTAACGEEMNRTKCNNADNQDLGPSVVLQGFHVGSVPEVNGLWAEEMPEFVPTRRELLVIAKHWAGIAIGRTYVEWSNAAVSVNTKDWRRIYFAWRRVYRIRALLGDVIDKLIDDQIKEFYEEQRGLWDPGTWNEFLRLIDREAQKEHLAPISDDYHSPSEANPQS